VTALEAPQRRALRVLRMAGELHKRGHQRVRIIPGVSASRVYWRCTVTSAARTAQDHGVLPAGGDLPEPPYAASYSSAQEAQYFGWEDATAATAVQLADLFQVRFPLVVEEGAGTDLAYAGWLVHVLGHAESGVFPVAYSDSWGPPPVGWLECTGGGLRILAPPAGEGRSAFADPDRRVPRTDVEVALPPGCARQEVLSRVAAGCAVPARRPRWSSAATRSYVQPRTRAPPGSSHSAGCA
jgi:hypothetical protein